MDGMLRKMSARQFREWATFVELEPLEPERADSRAGTIVMMLANAHRKKGSRAWTLSDCTPMFGDATAPRKRRMDWKAMKATGMTMTSESRDAAKRAREKRGRT